MDITKWPEKVMDTIKRYRYALLVLLLGIALMCWPSQDTKQTDSVSAEGPTKMTNAFLDEEELESILSHISGAGEVKVLLSCSSGEKTIYHQDETLATNENSTNTKKETVTLSDGNRQETVLITQVQGPTYLGAIILCSGADQPAVKLAVVEAVSKVTGLGSDHICVLKMK